MKAVRSTGDLATKVVVDDVDEPPGIGEVIDVRTASICSSDLMYIGYGLQRILGHEVAGVRADGTAVVVEAMYGCGSCGLCASGRYNLCPTHTDRALGVTIDGGMVEQYRAPATASSPFRRASTSATCRSWSPLRWRGTPCGSAAPAPPPPSLSSAPAGSASSPSPPPSTWVHPRSTWKPATPINASPPSDSAVTSAPTISTTS